MQVSVTHLVKWSDDGCVPVLMLAMCRYLVLPSADVGSVQVFVTHLVCRCWQCAGICYSLGLQMLVVCRYLLLTWSADVGSVQVFVTWSANVGSVRVFVTHLVCRC